MAMAQTAPLVPDPLTLPTPRPASKGAYQYGIEMLKLDRAWAITKGRAHVSIVDTGFIAHPDLTNGIDGNFRSHLSQTAQRGGGIPNVFHATMVAGVLAARGFDGKGVSGACPWCSLSIHLGSPQSVVGPVDIVVATNDAIASGASVINMSFGYDAEKDASKPQGSCQNLAAGVRPELCAVMRRTEERDLVVVSIAQNEANAGLGPTSDRVPFPANYPSVIAVGGVDSDGKFWATSYDASLPGSNWGPKIRVVAPAKDVLLPQAEGKYLYDYPPYRCGDRVDAPVAEAPTLPASYAGYGDCMGTSFAAPIVSGIAGLIRSVNPLLSASEVTNILYVTATQPVAGPAGSGLTFFLPDAEKAVQLALGSGVANRTSPMFSLYAADTQTHLFTSNPHTAVAAVAGELKRGGQTTTTTFASFGDPVSGYAQFGGRRCDAIGNNCAQPPARALFNIFTMEASPDGQRTLVPLFRLSQVCSTGASGCKAVRTFAYATDRTQVQTLEAKGYVVDAVEGYIYPAQATAPAGTQVLCLAFDATRIDYILYTGTGTSCNKTQLDNSAGQNTGGNYQAPVALGFVIAATVPAPVNYTDIWFNANESGWGIHLTHHNQELFGAWFTYDEQGNQLFITMPGCNLQRFDGATCIGDLYRTKGPSFTAPVFDPALVTATKIGSATLTFTGQDAATFNYRIGTANLTKAIQRQSFGSTARTAYPNDLSDHFYRPDASGWGVAVAEHGNKSFTVIYHYDTNGNPMFITLPDSQTQAAGQQTGTLYRTRSRGSHYLSSTWNPADIVVTDVGTGTLRANQTRLDFQFTVDDFSQQHLLTRLPF